MKVEIWNHLSGGFHRLLGPGEVLQQHGADVVIKTDIPNLLEWDHDWSCGPWPEPPPHAYVVGLVEKPEADVVVLQRPGRQWIVEAIAFLQHAGVRVVVDVDDAFWSVKWTADEYEARTPWRNREVVERACRIADAVTVTTPALAHHYGHGQAYVLPNLVPEWYLDVKPGQPIEAIGWSGVIRAHPLDLQVTGGAVGQVLRHHDHWEFAVVGESFGVAAMLALSKEPLETGRLPLDEYARAMAEIRVGIVPLAAIEFNASKSALKMAQFAALGVPVVASPSPDNRRLHALGVGELADSPDDWRRHLDRLLDSAEARAELAGVGREVMASQTYERHAGRWWEAWTGTVA